MYHVCFETIFACFDLHIHIINSNTAAAQVSFGLGICRCENAIFHQRGERVSKFHEERLGTHFGTQKERVMDAFGTQS